MRMILRFLSLLSSIALLWLSATQAAHSHEKRDNVLTLAAPIVAAPSQHWEGNDGIWSTFEIRVGTPPIPLRVLPATSWQETWVIGAYTSNCNTQAGQSVNCTTDGSRGGTFNPAASRTWHGEGEYNLGLNELLGDEGEGIYGLDTVGLGWNNSTGLELPQQIVATIISDQYLFGILGMGFQPSNLTDYATPKASFSDSLYSNGTISSKTWSYTAGAHYRLKSVFGQVIFGGYDLSRFVPNDMSFTMTGDNLRDIVLTIRSITSTTSSGSTQLMSAPESAFIDSTVTDLWLPAIVCGEFEQAFGIEADGTGRYLMNSTTHSFLQNLNPNITITLANEKSGGDTIDIVLPYQSFDVNVSAPLYPNGTHYYFPIRQGENDSMYTLGRVFLQEAYVTVNYNDRTFNVSQALFLDGTESQIVAIPSSLPNTTSTDSGNGVSATGISGTTQQSSDRLSGSAIAGVVVSVIIVFLLLGVLLFLCLRRRRRSSLAGGHPPRRSRSPVHEIDTSKRNDPMSSAYGATASAFGRSERDERHLGDSQDAYSKVEIDGNPIMHPQELEADVPMARTDKINNSSSDTTQISSLSNSPNQGISTIKASGTGQSNVSDRCHIEDDELEEYLVSPDSPRQGRTLDGDTARSTNGAPLVTVTPSSPT